MFKNILIILIMLICHKHALTADGSNSVVLRGGADFTDVTYTPDPALYGSLITYSIQITSGGVFGVTVDGAFSGLDASSFADLSPFFQTVTNFYDDGLGGGFTPDGEWDCNASTGAFLCAPDGINGASPGDLAPGAHKFDITVIVNNSTPPVSNVFSVDLTTTFGSPLTVPTTIQAASPTTTLETTLFTTQNPVNPVPSSSFEYAIEVSNQGNNDALNWDLEISSEQVSAYTHFSGPFICIPSICSISCAYDINSAGPLEPFANASLLLNAVAPENGPVVSTLLLIPMDGDDVSGANPIDLITTLNSDVIFNNQFEATITCPP